MRDYDSPANATGKRPVIGLNPPKSTGAGDEWKMTGNVTYGSNNPKSGHTWNTVPIWTKVQAAAATPAKKDDGGSMAAPAVKQAEPQATPASLTARREALDRAQQYKADTSAIPRPLPPGDPKSPSFYQDFQAYGRSVVDDYLQGRAVDQKRAELGIEEGAYFAKDSLDRIDPKKMNVTQPDTWKETLERLTQMKKLIS